MKQSLNLAPTQTLTMTPALQHALKMLQMSTLDLRMEIQTALESNLMLEVDEEDDRPGESDGSDTASDAADAGDVNVEWEQIYDPDLPPTSSATDSTSDWQANVSAASTLADYLHWQVELAPFTREERAVAAIIVDSIAPSGLIEDWPALAAQLAAEFELDAASLATILSRVQDFDPPGVAARDLEECVRLQLEQLPPETEGRATALALTTETGLAVVATHTPESLAAAVETSPEEIQRALALIRACRPDPGEAFRQTAAEPITPEIEVRHSAEGWHVALNSDILPRVRLNARYQELIKRGDRSESQATLKAHLKEARFFLGSLKSRNETLLEVAECLVKTQRAFLEYGPKALKPLVLREVAERIGVHESTISRATANKYMQTPRGVIELKDFFSSSVATADGGTVSATAIQTMLRALIADEARDQPVSDSQLAERLNADQGVRVARRTVAKYREAMGIPPSRKRRRP